MVAAVIVAHLFFISKAIGTFPIYLPLITVAAATVAHLVFISEAIGTFPAKENRKAVEKGKKKPRGFRTSERTKASTIKHVQRLKKSMCKSIVVSQDTLENYNSLLKSHVNEAVKNRSAMHFADQQGMSQLEFHGGSTVISVLIVIFVLIGMYLFYHFVIRKCKPFDPNTDPEWRRHPCCADPAPLGRSEP